MNRRDFLSTVAVVPALSVRQAPRAAAPPPARGGLKLGTVTYNIAKDWDVPTIIKNLTEIGFDAVELRTTHKHGVEISLTPAQRAEVRKQFEGSAVKIGGLGTTCEYHSPDPAVVRKNIDETKEWVKLAKDIGSPGVKVRPNGLPKDVPEEKTLEQIGKSLAECGAFAQEHGVILRALGDSIGFSPPLIIDESEIAALVEGFGRALNDALGIVRAQDLATLK